MKKLFIAVAVVGLGVFATSCKKEYTCECTFDTGNGTQTEEYKLGKQKKSDAEAACDNTQSTLAGSGVECKLK